MARGEDAEVAAYTSTTLQLIKSPLAERKNLEAASLSNSRKPSFIADTDVDDGLEFAKYKLFYDLWFVANLNVFSTVHEMNDVSSVGSFVGYILLLWTTWLLTTLYDVRYVTESVWERLCRAVHLAVMVGFAELGPTFDFFKEAKSVFRAMCLFLMVSRLILTLQYFTVLLQIRKHRETRVPLMVATGIHLLFSVVYLAVSFLSVHEASSVVAVSWYLGAVAEIAIHLGLSSLKALSLSDTHLSERMNLLTLIILGEGAIIIARNIQTVVKNTFLKDSNNMWSAALIGVVTCAVALIYFVYQMYFDWMHSGKLTHRRQMFWVSCHLPFHVVLVLLLEGANQFIAWSQALQSIKSAAQSIININHELSSSPTTKEVVQRLNETVTELLESYPPENEVVDLDDVEKTYKSLLTLPDSFWNVSGQLADNDPEMVRWLNGTRDLAQTVFNGIFASFSLAAPAEETESTDVQSATEAAYLATANKFGTVFIYAFITAGLVLILMTALHVDIQE
ncbi:bacterial low temperature requirement A domain-containing protein [Trichoderma pleuroticola]